MNETMVGWTNMLSGTLAAAGGGQTLNPPSVRGALVDDAANTLVTDTGDVLVYAE